MEKGHAMPRRKSKTLTQVELEFMQAVWERGEVTTEDMLEYLAARGRHLSDGSVRKILSILVAKGYVVRRPDGRAFRYKAAVAEGRANRSMLLDLVERAFAGSPALMVASLLDNTRMSKKDLAAIKQLIAEKEKGQ
jgi:BlaI family transcriptional regulator, penicillinase repressor